MWGNHFPSNVGHYFTTMFLFKRYPKEIQMDPVYRFQRELREQRWVPLT